MAAKTATRPHSLSSKKFEFVGWPDASTVKDVVIPHLHYVPRRQLRSVPRRARLHLRTSRCATPPGATWHECFRGRLRGPGDVVGMVPACTRIACASTRRRRRDRARGSVHRSAGHTMGLQSVRVKTRGVLAGACVGCEQPSSTPTWSRCGRSRRLGRGRHGRTAIASDASLAESAGHTHTPGTTRWVFRALSRAVEGTAGIAVRAGLRVVPVIAAR